MGLLLATALGAQPSGTLSTPMSFAVDAGLEGAMIRGAAFHEGAMWFATSVGLVRYDGFGWSRYALADGLPSEMVTTVCSAGPELWVGTDRGAGVFDGSRFRGEGPMATALVRRIAARAEEVWICGPSGTHRRTHAAWQRVEEAREACDLVRLAPSELLVVTPHRLLRVADEGTAELPLPPDFEVAMHASAALEPASGRLVVSTRNSARAWNDAAGRWDAFGEGTGAFPRLLSGRAPYLLAVWPQAATFCSLEVDRPVPLSRRMAAPCGTLLGLAEAGDGRIWAYGDGLLVGWRPPARMDPLPPPLFADSQGRVWFGDPERVGVLRKGTFEVVEDLTLPVAPAGARVLGRARDDDEVVVVVADERRIRTRLPFTEVSNLLLETDGTGIAWAVVNGPAAGAAWLDPADDQWHAIELERGPGAFVRSVAADPRGGVWLALRHDESSRLVHVQRGGAQECIEPPEDLGCPDVAVDARGRLFVGGVSGLWARSAGGAWSPIGQRWARTIDWIAAVGERAVAGTSASQDGPAGILVIDDAETHTFGAATPVLVGRSAAGLLVAAGKTIQVVPPRGLVLTLAGVHGRDVTSVVFDGEFAWAGRSGRTSRADLAPAPLLLVDAGRGRLVEGAPVEFEVQAAFPFVARSELIQPCASISYRIDGGAWTESIPLESPIVVDLAAGRHDIEFVARDALGRVSPVALARVHVASMPLQDRWWFPFGVAAVVLLVLGLTIHAMLTQRRLADHAKRLRAAVERRTHKIRSELLRRRRAERHVRHQHRVLGLLATGKPLEQALDALVLGLEEQLPPWRGVICLLDGERLTLVSAPGLPPAARELLDGRLLQEVACPCSRAVRERSRILADGHGEDPKWVAAARAAGVEALYTQPILSTTGSVHGVLALLHDGELSSIPQPIDMELVDAAAHIAAVAIDSHRGEAQRQELQQQVLNAQKLRSLGLLAGGIAHDFNNLLTGILGNAGLARLQSVSGSPVDLVLAQVEIATERAAELCTQLLAYSGRGRFVVKPIDLSVLVQEMVQMLRLPMSGKISLELRLSAQRVATEADATQVRQVLMNLMTNAAEALGDRHGHVTIATGVAELSPARLRGVVVGSGVEPGWYVFAEVRDSGCGMSEVTRRHVFDPFFTTKSTGRGLGMAAVQGIVQGHRGAIELESEEGRGTTIRVFFPASDKHVEELPRAVAAAPRARQHGVVLVAEDEPIVRELARSVLAGVGFDVVIVADGTSAARLVDDNASDFRLVLLDIVMPGLTGHEVLGRIRARNPELPVILSSGNEMADTEAFGGDPFTHFLKKPYGPQALLESIRRALASVQEEDLLQRDGGAGRDASRGSH